jgi:hypothetical protein
LDFGIPGGIYWLWKLKQHKFDEELNTETEELTITAE